MSRSVYVSLGLGVFSAMLGMGIVAPLLPVYAQEYGATEVSIGLLFASFSLSRTVVLPAIGRMSDRWGRKVFIVPGLLLFALTSVGYMVAGSVEHLIAARMVQGVAAAMVLPVALAYIGENSSPGKEGTTMGVFNMFFFFGLGAGPVVGGFFKDLWGIHSSFLIMGLCSLAGFALAALLLPESEGYTRRTATPLLPARALLADTRILSIYVFRLCYSIGIGMIWTFLPVYGDNFLRLSGSQIGILVSLNILIASVLQSPCGKLADRTNRLVLVCIGGGMAAVAHILIPMTGSFGQLFCVNVLWGVAGGVSMPAVSALAVEEGKRVGEMGRLMSMFMMFHSIGMIIGPLLAGILAQVFTISFIFIAGAIIGVAGVIGFVHWRRNQHSARPPLGA
jgi:MFS family permease